MGNDLSIGNIYESTAELLRLARERAAEPRIENASASIPVELNPKSSANFGNKNATQTSSSPNEKTVSNNDWTSAGAINTQNLTADKASQGLGRDELEANKSHILLDTQLDNKNNTFINFTKDGKEYLAFRSNDELRGNYYGFKEKGETNWRHLKDAPIDGEKLKQHLEKVHDEKQKTIDKVGGYENYKSLQTIQGEIADLNELNGDSKKESHAELAALTSEIKALKQEGYNNNLNSDKIQEKYLAIKTKHPELATDLVMNRFTKAATLVGEEKLQASFNKLDTSLKELGAKQDIDGYDLSAVKDSDKAKVLTITEEAQQEISKEIDAMRDAGQKLTTKEQADKDRINKELSAALKTLEASQGNNPEFQKLKQYHETLSNDTNKEKYSLNQLRSLQGYLNSKNWNPETTKIQEIKVSSAQEFRKALNDLAPGTRIKISDNITTSYFTKDSQGNIYKDDGNKIAQEVRLTAQGVRETSSNYKYQIKEQDSKLQFERLNPTGIQDLYVIDQEGKERTVIGKVFNDKGEASYQNIPAKKLEQTNIDTYTLVDAEGKKHYYSFMANSEKNKAWEVKLANDKYSKIQAGLTEDTYNARKSYEQNGLKFFFEANGSFIGLMAAPSREKKLDFDAEEFKNAQRFARTKSFFSFY